MSTQSLFFTDTDGLDFPVTGIFNPENEPSYNYIFGATPQQSVAPAASPSPALNTRVCDRCIRKKVKCDMNRPTCSRCREGDWPCLYSSARRKPGPARGSRRKASSNQNQAGINARTRARPSNTDFESSTQNLQDVIEGTNFSTMIASSQAENSTGCEIYIPQILQPMGQTASNFGLSVSSGLSDLQLDPHDEFQLLNNFFAQAHPSLSLFSKEHFFQQYQSSSVSRGLLLTIFALSAKIFGTANLYNDFDFDSVLQALLATTVVDSEEMEIQPSLHIFKQACLLTFYEFHQHPGQRAWRRIGQLTRKAYERGLHQLENREQCPLYDDDLSDIEIEDWRGIWWFIYCLDSYSNITAAVPFVIELDSIQTALVTSSSVSTPASSESGSQSAIFLSSDINMLWKTVKQIVQLNQDINSRIHMITTTILREAGTLYRLKKTQEPTERLFARIATLQQNIASIRLALPDSYLNPTRNMRNNESSLEHHARLVCLIHLHISRLLISLPPYIYNSSATWLYHWQASLEYCQDIVAVITEWDKSFYFNVDPAVCFIVLTCLTTLFLHSRSGLSLDPDMQELVTKQCSKLLLFLNRFGRLWYLPQLLIRSYEQLIEMCPQSLTFEDIEMILKRLQTPLHPNTLKKLSTPPQQQHAATPESISQNLETVINNTFTFNGD